uniref:Uncharacterized protein n=1 Tax=Ananas comosus var. bracteatus TaxID=296719 RepID=A0A6V7NSU8_ANACO|nr:unnamed protein product [Ananas comosus var. bracteatus]
MVMAFKSAPGRDKRRSGQLIRPPYVGTKAADLGFLAEDAKLLLRCCLSVFRLLEFDLSLVVEVCEVLLVELRRVFECDIGRLYSGDIRVNHAFSTPVVEGLLISASSQFLMANFLKQLHTLLSNFSGSESGSHFADVLNVSNFIFEELKRRSGPLIRPPHVGAKATDLGFLAEDVKLLLRCCLSVFQLLEFDLSLVMEVCEVLLVELRRVFECDIGRLDLGNIRVNHAFSTAVVEGCYILSDSVTLPDPVAIPSHSETLLDPVAIPSHSETLPDLASMP